MIERTIHDLLHVVEHSLSAEETAKTHGLLQRLDPRVKVSGFLAVIIAVVQARSGVVIVGLFTVSVVLALLSSVSLRTLAIRAWLGVLLFTGFIALPAIFLVPGEVVYRLPLLAWPITAQGLRSAAYLLARAETTATFGLLLILCTPWTHVLKALRVLRVPVVFVVILGMTHRYIFLLLQTAHDMFEARRSRMTGTLSGPERRHLATASAGVLLSKSIQVSSEVYLAMQSRGYRGEVFLLDDFQMQPYDWIGLAGFLLLAVFAVWLGQ